MAFRLNSKFEYERKFAIATAIKAGNLLMSNYYGKQNEELWKTHTNFGIEADKNSDEFIRSEIIKRFPEDSIMSEEDEPVNKANRRKWCYDPLDGTIFFSRHLSDNFSVSIPLLIDKEPVVGAVYLPARKQLYCAERGERAFCANEVPANGNENNLRYVPIKVSQEDALNHAVIEFDDGKETATFRRDSIALYYAKISSPSGPHVLRYSGAAAALCHVASGMPNKELPLVGRLDAYIGASLEPWDMAAGVLIIREAGGKVTNLRNEEWKLGDESILAANPKLHEKFHNHLNQ